MEYILNRIEQLAKTHDKVSPDVIREKNIKIGLRNTDGTGVIVGITSKGTVIGYDRIKNPDGTTKIKPTPGKLLYCGYDALNLVRQYQAEGRYGFDEVTYLLLTGELPAAADLEKFSSYIKQVRELNKKEREVLIQEAENDNQMYALHSVVSHLSRTDANADTGDISEITRQCINLIAKAPVIVAYNYNVLKFMKRGDLNILMHDPELETAANFLYLLRGQRPTEFEARLMDMAMILHAEHGGGNNSTFTVRCVSSTGANTYMAICAGIASLSGYLHGGANDEVMTMMEDIKTNVRDWTDDDEVKSYLGKMLDGTAGNGSGKIFGIGHAVYTLSDPRAEIFREKVEEYAGITGNMEEYGLYNRVANIAPRLVMERKNTVAAPNVDFYSGFLYKMMGIPQELYTPIFAMSRFVGWAAHRIEQVVQNKIIRPAFETSLKNDIPYVPLNLRK